MRRLVGERHARRVIYLSFQYGRDVYMYIYILHVMYMVRSEQERSVVVGRWGIEELRRLLVVD